MNKAKLKVLVAAPTADRKNYCLNEYLSVVSNLTYSNYKTFLADNSETRSNAKMLNRLGVHTKWINPAGKTNIQYIAESHESCREFALHLNFDYMLHLESDIIPPIDIIERLLFHKKEVVSACYFTGFGDKSRLCIQLLEDSGELIRETQNMDYGIGDMIFMDGTLKQVYGAGLGCTLIHKSVLEKIKFRYQEGVDAHPDTYFYSDLNASGIKQYVDTSILCKHENREWSFV
jgi:hypothetical protein